MINRLCAVALGCALSTLSAPSSAGVNTGWRTIVDYGCHKGDGTCWINLDGAPVSGGTNCSGTTVRWDTKNDVNGKNWLALVLMAKATGKRINLNVEGCYTSQPDFPTFIWGSIEG